MGRPPKSVEEHKSNGTYKPSRHDGRGISIEPLETLPAPVSLSKRAAEKWNEIVPAMLAAGLVSVVDAVILKDAFISCLIEMAPTPSLLAFLVSNRTIFL